MAQHRQLISSLSALSRRGFIRPFAALLLGVVLLAMIVHMRRGPSPWRPPAGSARFAEATRKFFRSQSMIRAEDHAALVSAFESADFFYDVDYDEDGNTVSRQTAYSEVLNEEQRSALIETVAQIIELRSRADAGEYAQWMRSRGYQLRSVDEQLSHPAYVNWFKFAAGRDVAPDETPWTLFKDMYEGELVHGRGGVTRPVGVVSEPHTRELWIATTNSPGPLVLAFDPIFFAKMKEADSYAEEFDSPNFSKQMIWSVGQGYAGWPHWSPPISFDEVIARDGDVLCARAQCILRTTKGGIIPIVFNLYYDPTIDTWLIPAQRQGITYANTYELDLFFTGPEF